MSSEEKEPYFDGPLVTPPSGQAILYPGANPQHNFGQLAGPGPAASFPQQAGPAFYNPNNFMAQGATSNPWGMPVAQEPQMQQHMNGPPGSDVNTSLSGTQAYFGGVDTSSSTSSSLHTSPEHLPRQKVNDIPHNPALYEPQAYAPQSHASTLFAPQMDGTLQPSTQIFNPAAPATQGFSPQEQKIHNASVPPGGASGQHGYAHPPTSTFFVPNSGPVSQEVQNYMNPVPHDSPLQPSLFTPNTEGHGILQPALEQQNNSASEGPFKNESVSPINPMDLHNGMPPQSQAGNDQSYMNIAYNHDYSGIIASQSGNVNAYVSAEIHVGASAMVIPTSSSQDYDILHSQGTWEKQNYASVQNDPRSEMPVTEPTDVPPLEEMGHGVHGSGAAHGVDVEDGEAGATGGEVPPEREGPSHSHEVPQDTPNQDLPQRENAAQQNLDIAGEPESLEQKTVLPLYDPTVNNRSNLSDTQKQESAHGLSANNELIEEPHLDIETLDAIVPSGPAEDATLSLDYNSGSGSLNLPDLQDNTGYAYGPITSVSQDNASQQSYTKHDLGAAALLPDLTHQEQTASISGSENQAISSVRNYEDGYGLTETSESPIPADGLHPKLSTLESTYSPQSLHQFASPNSAFESRIRSQSTGSNNSNASSQRSATNYPYRNVQNRSALAPYPAAALEISSSPRQDTAPTSNPFSTDTMHSSHMADHDATPPLVTAPPTRSLIPAIPDIVRPLPGGSADENLRTGATVPFSSTNQSLHSQVLRNRTAYPPEPVVNLPQSVPLTSSRPQPDLIQSPPEAGSTQLRTSAEVSHTVMALKTSEPPPNRIEAAAAATSGAASVSSDPYLSRSLHNSLSGFAAPSSRNQELAPQPSVVQSHDNDSHSQDSSLPPLSARTDDLHQRDVDDRQHLEPRRHDEDSRHHESSDRDPHGDGGRRGSRDSRWDDHSRHDEDPRHRESSERDPHGDDGRRGSRDSRWDEYRRHDEDYRRRDYSQEDDRYGSGGRWDSRDRYDDSSRSRHEYNSRPGSRQSGHPDSYYTRSHDDRYGRHDYREYYSRDGYYNDRYQGYDSYYPYDDRRRDTYNHDSYRDRYPDSWSDRDRQYYWDSYRQDYRYHSHRRPEDEDSRSILSERSRVADHTYTGVWHGGHEYDEQYDYRQGYDHGYYADSLADESTLSNAQNDSWPRLPQVHARQTPAKFTTTHTVVRFGPGGQLIKVQPNRPTDNQPSTVEIHSLEFLLQNTQEAEDLRSYPGPLSKDETHKNDVLQFAAAHSCESMKDMDLLDRRSTALIWDFLALLVRQNGSVLGTDIAELLTSDHSGDFTLMQSPLEASRQRQLQLQQQRTTTPSSISDDLAGASSPAPEQSEAKSTISSQSTEIAPGLERNCSRFRELLLHGRRKDALEWAMKSGLWGHALLLASKTDNRTHAQVMLRFANSLPINDPLQTVYQLMSGRQPAAATCVSEEGWGDWRPHLAMILSNPTSSASLDMRAVLTMGDTLSSRGLLHAAHFCYLMSSTPLGYYGRPASKMVLLGGNHLLSFTDFATWDSIRRTEIYEYAISLGKPHKAGSNSAPAALPAFQLYKFIYACKLAEYGMVAQAFHYCERIAKSVCRSPSSYSATLVNQLMNVSDQLRHHDPQIQAGVSEPGNLRWLETLRNINLQIQSGAIVPRANVTSSLVTTSNTPSVVSTSPTTDSQNDDIQFSAHTPDQDDMEDELDSGMPNPQTTMPNYNQNLPPQVAMYSAQPTNNIAAPPMVSNMGAGYNQDQNQVPMHDPNVPTSYGDYQYQPQGRYMQPNMHSYAQPQVPTGDFSQLANQANPLAPGFIPPSGAPNAPYQHQNSYGFNPEPPTPSEEAERGDQVDYYDYMANTHKVHRTRSGSPRSRTISQSSQHSRASTLKGYDRTSPTAMVNHTDKGRRSRTTSENSAGRRSRKTSGEEPKRQKPKEDMDEMGVKKSSSWSLFSWLSRRKSRQVHLPDDKEKEIVWDNDKKRWVNKNATEEESAPPAPPPMDNALSNSTPQLQTQANTNQNQNAGQPLPPTPEETDFVGELDRADGPPITSSPNSLLNVNNNGEGQLTANRFSLKNLGGNRSMYKNAFSSSSKPVVAAAPADLLPGLQNATIPQPTGFMIPNPVPVSQPANDQAPASTPMHPPNAAQSIQMFTPGNTPHGSAGDFSQPFNHGGDANMGRMAGVPAPEQENAAPGPTMFFNPSQFAAQPDLLSQPAAPMGRGNALTRRGRGRPGYPGRR